MTYKPFLIKRPKFLEIVICDPFKCISDPLYEIRHPEERWLLLIPGLLAEVAADYRINVHGRFVSPPHHVSNVDDLFMVRAVGRGSSIGNVFSEARDVPKIEKINKLCDLYEEELDPFVRFNINDHILLEKINMTDEERSLLIMRRFLNLVKEIGRKNISVVPRIIDEARMIYSE